MKPNKFAFGLVCLIFCLLFFGTAAVEGQTTAFSCQGRLTNLGVPANGVYEIEFKLFDAPAGGTQIGGSVTRNGFYGAAGKLTFQT